MIVYGVGTTWEENTPLKSSGTPHLPGPIFKLATMHRR